ncbi:hypothetical protein [Haloferax sp. DFSO52]|uniref:hypothetical protein n=1 Tax=Haloferax sp. DFSO52 TaxID=3388505 RepID=UPI003A86E33F
MPSAAKTALLLVALGGVILGGSYALDATTPDTTINYGVYEISQSDGSTPAIVAYNTRRTRSLSSSEDNRGPAAGTISLQDEVRQSVIRNARNGSYTIPADDEGRLSYLTEYQYYAVEGDENADGTEVYHPYRVTTTRSDDTVRISAERVSLETYYGALALPLEQADSRTQDLLRDGSLETHDPIGWTVIRDGDQFYQIYVDEIEPHTGFRVSLHDNGYIVGWVLVVVGGLWWLSLRGRETTPHGGEYS